MRRVTASAAAALAVLAPAAARSAAPGQPPDGLVLAVAGGHLKVAFCASDVVRVSFAREAAFFDRASLAAGARRCQAVPVKRTDATGQATLATPKVQVRVDLATGRLAFLDAAGREVLAEEPGGRSLEPAEVQGERTFHVRQRWVENADESLYGLGQHQLGLADIKGYDLDLWQHNATVVVPFLVSSRGYGILWDNTSFTRFGDLREWAPIPAGRLFDASGEPGGLTGSYHAGSGFEKLVATRVDQTIDVAVASSAKQPNLRIHPSLPPEGPASVRWEGAVEIAEPGDHQFQLFSNGGIRMWVDGQLVADHWRQGWLPWKDVARVPLARGRHALQVEWSKDQGMETVQLLWKTPAKARATSLWSEVGDGVDYYFVYGPDLDRVVAGYRRLTGEAPMMPRWAFGLWQSRQRYETQQQSLDVVDGFRSRRIPFDNIVQDWFYWPENAWGSHRFDPAALPRPRRLGESRPRPPRAADDLGLGQVLSGQRELRGDAREGLPVRAAAHGGLQGLGGSGLPLHLLRRVHSRGASALLVAGEPRPLPPRHGRVVDGRDRARPPADPRRSTGSARTCTRPRMGTGSRDAERLLARQQPGVYEGQRKAAPDQRVFILTRSGFAGQQRYAAATWSGDITSTWTALRQQITAGLGLLDLGDPVLDDGHRRLLRARPLFAQGPSTRGRRGVARAQHPLVPVRHVRPAHSASTARRRSARCGRWAASRTRPTRRTSSSTGCATGCSPTSTRWPGR